MSVIKEMLNESAMEEGKQEKSQDTRRDKIPAAFLGVQ